MQRQCVRRFVTTLLVVVSIATSARQAEAYYWVNNLDYYEGEGGGELWAHVGTYRDWWDPIGGRWYDYWCECYIYWTTYMTTVGELYRPSGSLAAAGVAEDVHIAGLWLNGYPPDEPGNWTQFGSHYVTQRVWDEGAYYCGGWAPCEQFYTTAVYSSLQRFVSPGCGDERDELIVQYVNPDRPVGWVPGCNDFTDVAPTNSHYDFSSWRSADRAWNWAILRESVVGNNYCILSNLGWVPNLNSGYRTPDHNANEGGARSSRHVLGDAADLATPGDPEWNYLRYLAKDSGACGYACVEPRDLTPSWFHHDYRGSCPAGW